jgi:hypothetical protein
MFLTFRQGIVKKPTGSAMLDVVGDQVDLLVFPENLIITFAHGDNNYLLSENETIYAAWAGSFVNTNNYYFYVDINIETGARTFGYTQIQPSYGHTLPGAPLPDTHFFDTSVNAMKVYSGVSWDIKLRVFLGELLFGGILNEYNVGSQTGLNSNNNSGFILFDDLGFPIYRKSSIGPKALVTTETILNTQNNATNPFKMESVQVDGKAVEPIPKFYCVSWKGIKQIGLASSEDSDYPCVGLATEAITKGQIKKFASSGFITNPNWNFSVDPNTPVWVGKSGEVTTTVPTRKSMQRIGFVVDTNTIFLDIKELMIIA